MFPMAVPKHQKNCATGGAFVTKLKKNKLQKIKNKNQVGLSPLPISTRWPDVPVYLDSPHFEPCVPADQQLCCFVLVPGVPFISIWFFFPFIKSTRHVVAHHKGFAHLSQKSLAHVRDMSITQMRVFLILKIWSTYISIKFISFWRNIKLTLLRWTLKGK